MASLQAAKLEAQYGQLFLSNYQCAPFPPAPLWIFQQPASVTPAASLAPASAATAAAPSPAAASRPAALQSVQQDDAAPKPMTASPMFALKPPPPPNSTCAVGSPQASQVKAVVIDELQAARSLVQPKTIEFDDEEDDAQRHQRLNVTGVVADDDEQNLLGADSVKMPVAQIRHAGDGIDSDSDDGDKSSAPPPAPRGARSPGSEPSSAPASPPTTQASSPPRGAPRSPPRATPPVEDSRSGATPKSPPASAVQASGKADGSPDQFATADAQVGASLERFFRDEGSWERVANEVAVTGKPAAMEEEVPAGASGAFKVQVPKPYPGVQYRRSMCLEDKFSKYAADGNTVSGIVEEGGEWLRITGTGAGPSLFLPMRIGNIQILRPITPAAAKQRKQPRQSVAPRSGGGLWWSCCPSKDSIETSEVVVNQGGEVAGGVVAMTSGGQAGGPVGPRSGRKAQSIADQCSAAH